MRLLRTVLGRFRTSRIGLRVLAFNLLVLFLPVAGILYLDLYEARLLEALERGMVDQARIAAAALGGSDTLDVARAADLVARLGVERDSRIRIYDTHGRVVADSSRNIVPQAAPESYLPADSRGRDRILYRFGAWLAAVKRATIDPVMGRLRQDESQPREPLTNVPQEVVAALEGRYGAATRPTPGQRSLTLNSAVPIRGGSQVIGAAVISQSTLRILQALYTLRLRIFEVVVASMVVAALLSLLMSATIVRPLVRLRHAAASLADRRGPLTGTFRVVDRRDEIGDLAHALEQLTLRLDAHIRLVESFAADVAHEFKNPLASIRTASEMLAADEDPADRARFLRMLVQDVDRLERLVSGVRDLARIDAQLAHEPVTKVDVARVVEEVLQHCGAAHVSVQMPQQERLITRASRDRLFQVFENLVDNALGFSPDGRLEIDISRADHRCRITIADSGPGIPPAHLERVFERFFTYRPGEPNARRNHTGLGLAIARTIVEGYGGAIGASNRTDGGACFSVELPLAAVERRVLASEPASIS